MCIWLVDNFNACLFIRPFNFDGGWPTIEMVEINALEIFKIFLRFERLQRVILPQQLSFIPDLISVVRSPCNFMPVLVIALH